MHNRRDKSFQLQTGWILALSIVAGLVLRLVWPDATPAAAWSESAVPQFHLLAKPATPNARMVIFDTRLKKLYVFSFDNHRLRLRSWRDVSRDAYLWDTSVMVDVPAAQGLEKNDGMPTQNLFLPAGQVDLVKVAEEQYRKYGMQNIRNLEHLDP